MDQKTKTLDSWNQSSKARINHHDVATPSPLSSPSPSSLLVLDDLINDHVMSSEDNITNKEKKKKKTIKNATTTAEELNTSRVVDQENDITSATISIHDEQKGRQNDGDDDLNDILSSSTTKTTKQQRQVPLPLFREKQPLSSPSTPEKSATAPATATTTASYDAEKKKFNFAAYDVGAKVLSTNPEAKKASRILNEDKDNYMLIPRHVDKKYITIELSEEILMNSFALANFEYYSSSPHLFQVLGSREYPCRAPKCYWEVLGTFEAQNTRSVQKFMLQKPFVARYVKFLFLTQYGETEYFWTLTLIRVHGSTLLEDLRDALYASENSAASVGESTTVASLSDPSNHSATSRVGSTPFSSNQQSGLSSISGQLDAMILDIEASSVPIDARMNSASGRNTIVNSGVATEDDDMTVSRVDGESDDEGAAPSVHKERSDSPESSDNILKSLLIKIQRQEESHKTLAADIQKIHSKYIRTFRDIQRILNNTSYEHNMLASAVYSMANELKNEIIIEVRKGYMKEIHNLRVMNEHRMQLMLHNLTEAIHGLRTDTSQSVNSYKKFMIICMSVPLILMVFVLLLCIPSSQVAIIKQPDVIRKLSSSNNSSTEIVKSTPSKKSSRMRTIEELENDSDIESDTINKPVFINSIQQEDKRERSSSFAAESAAKTNNPVSLLKHMYKYFTEPQSESSVTRSPSRVR